MTRFLALCLCLCLLPFACLAQPFPNILLAGENHGVKAIMDQELKMWGISIKPPARSICSICKGRDWKTAHFSRGRSSASGRASNSTPPWTRPIVKT